MPVSAELFRDALSRLAAGISIVTAGSGTRRRGMTATAICSVSAAPPTVLICVNAGNSTADAVKDGGWFAVNLLAEQHRGLAEIFAGRRDITGDARFLHGEWSQATDAELPLLRGALASLECRVVHVMRVGTHDVFFGEVEAVHLGGDAPLIYHRGGFHCLPAQVPVA